MSDDSVPLVLPLSRLSAGSGETTTLYRELRKPLLRYLICIGLTNDEAQDVIQDVFLSLQRHLASGGDSGGPRANMRSWVFRVAHNQARNRQVSYERRFASPLDAAAESALDETTPEHMLLEKERFRLLERAIGLLSESERECLLLRSSGLRYREIGEVLAMATSTVADTVERAIRKLAEMCNV